jgi:hypothetical protein
MAWELILAQGEGWEGSMWGSRALLRGGHARQYSRAGGRVWQGDSEPIWKQFSCFSINFTDGKQYEEVVGVALMRSLECGGAL